MLECGKELYQSILLNLPLFAFCCPCGKRKIEEDPSSSKRHCLE